jgi:hypothetical protein
MGYHRGLFYAKFFHIKEIQKKFLKNEDKSPPKRARAITGSILNSKSFALLGCGL